MKTELSHSEQQAQSQLGSIKEMVEALRWFDERPDFELEEGADDLPGIDGEAMQSREQAEERIQEGPLSVQVRYGWISPGNTKDMLKDGPEEFEILLCTGGPACRIVGRLSEHGEPESARIEHQDWGTPWTEHRISGEEEDIVLEYCRQFYFGE